MLFGYGRCSSYIIFSYNNFGNLYINLAFSIGLVNIYVFSIYSIFIGFCLLCLLNVVGITDFTVTRMLQYGKCSVFLFDSSLPYCDTVAYKQGSTSKSPINLFKISVPRPYLSLGEFALVGLSRDYTLIALHMILI